MQLTNFPAELRTIPNWLVWRYEDVQARKPTKVPYDPRTGRHADVSNSATWTPFETAAACLAAHSERYSGVGFVMHKSANPAAKNYVVIDLDDGSALANGEPNPDWPAIMARQVKVLEAFDSYSEISPSGKGLHIFVEGEIPSGRRRGFIEMYDNARYITVTGDSYPRDQAPKPIKANQELLNILWEQLGGTSKQSTFQGSYSEPDSDATIVERALNAANGDKFATLNAGRWQDYYASQSEADFAYCDIIAFYTDSPNQITRIFRASPLGQRDKAQRSDYVQYMLRRVFDRKLPPVEIETNNNAIEAFLANQRAAPLAQPPIVQAPPAVTHAPAPEQPVGNPYTIPPGLLGQLAQFIYSAAPRPVPEIALAGAIGLMAGICGRAWNVSNTGLNQYVLLLAPTGTGKEAMASGTSRLIAAAMKQCSAITQFIGPGEIASGQALLKYLSRKSSCFVSIVGEFGLKMQQLSSQRANPAEMMLKRVLLDLYNKSGATDTLQPAVYSQKEDNTDLIYAPAVSLLGESTPETFFAAVDEMMISDGLLPRFTFVEYRGNRPAYNKTHASTFPTPQLVADIATLAAIALKAGQEQTLTHVKATPEADELLEQINLNADAMINSMSLSDVNRHLWNRAHMKTMKLAALVAVGVNPMYPVMTLEHVKWARAIVERDITKLQIRFESGEIGGGSEDSKQASEVKRVICEHIKNDAVSAVKYGSTSEMHRDKVVPYGYINKRLTAVAAFRRDKSGATISIKRAIQTLIDSGMIAEVGRTDMQTKYGTAQKAYSVLDVRMLV